MKELNSPISPEISEILKSSDPGQGLRELFAEMHPHDIFVLCEDLDDLEMAECIRALGIPLGIEVFEQFDDERKKDIFEHFSRSWMADVLEEMSHDERADFVKSMPEEKSEEVLPLVARAERNDIKRLIEYEEDTAGAILTTDYASLPPDITVKEAVERLKHQAFDRETIYYIYVTDPQRKLIGFVSLRDLIVAPSHRTVEDIMHKNVISASVNDDKEEVARMLSDYDFLAIPIVDREERLVGIVTVDDVVDVVEEEATEDIYKYGAAGEYIDYMKSNSIVVARQRTLWLLILVLVGFVSAWVLENNSYQLQSVVALSFFIPLLLGSAGNAGTQASTVVIRGLATGDIHMGDLFAIVRKEVRVGVIVGSVMGLLVAARAWFLDESLHLGLVVGVTMVAIVTIATSLGAFLPILFKRLRLDPALMSGPFITSIMDIVSLVIYFFVATLIF